MCLRPSRPLRPVQAPSQDLTDVGGRLRRYSHLWRSIADPEVQGWLAEGFRLDFPHGPPVHRPNPVDSAARLAGDPTRLVACADTIQAYMDKKILELVPECERGEGLYQVFFPVPKKNPGEWRGCLDARPVNAELRYEKFKMEGLQTVKSLLRRDDWLTSIDVADAYPHVLIHPEDRQYVRFIWAGVHYQFRAVCFGLASAPRMFTKIMRPIMAVLRAFGIRSVVYLDDLFLMAPSLGDSLEKTQRAVDTLVHFGFLVSPKSELVPRRVQDFLGMTVDSHAMELRVPHKKVKNFKDAVRRCLQRNAAGSLSLRELAGVLGKITAMTPAVLPARLLSRHLLDCKNRAMATGGTIRWEACVHLDQAARVELEEWQHLLDHWNGRSVIPPAARHVVTTDASHYGWGAWLRGQDARGFWTRAESRVSSNRRELKTAVLGVQSFASQLEGSVVEIRTDNAVTMAYINHQGGRNPALTALVRPLWEWALATKTTVFATYIPGKLNVRADQLSRVKRDRTDWMLNRREFRAVEQRWGPFTLDAFATRLNRQLPRYCSWRPDPEATLVDALQQDYTKERAWANPPFNLIGRFLARIKRQRATAVVVVPAWPTQPWWPLLAEMLTAEPVLLPHRSDLFLPGHLGNEIALLAPRWSVIACRISGAPSSLAAFRRRLRIRSSASGRTARPAATTRRGADGTITVPGAGTVPFMPLYESWRTGSPTRRS